MTETREEAAISYLRSLIANDQSRVDGLKLGQTTLSEIEDRYAFIDRIGNSYSGGPVVSLVDWELSIEGISGIELGFNAKNCLDVMVVRLASLGLEDLQGMLTMERAKPCNDETDLTNRAFYSAPHCQIQLEADPIDNTVSVTLSSAAFQQKKNCYRYA